MVRKLYQISQIKLPLKQRLTMQENQRKMLEAVMISREMLAGQMKAVQIPMICLCKEYQNRHESQGTCYVLLTMILIFPALINDIVMSRADVGIICKNLYQFVYSIVVMSGIVIVIRIKVIIWLDEYLSQKW